MAIKLIETRTLAVATAAIDFTGIPQDGTDLLIFISGRTTSEDSWVELTINSNVSSVYSYMLLQSTGGGRQSYFNSTRYIGDLSISTDTANTFSNNLIQISRYSENRNKVNYSDSVTENNGTNATANIINGLFSNTSPIESLSFYPRTGIFVSGTTISLYKITKGSDGIVTTS